MDHKTTSAELKSQVREFCEERDWDQFHGAKDLAIGLITEASELLEHFRFKSETQIELLLQDEARRREVASELADCYFFLLRFSQKYNFDLSQAFSDKMARNAERYPAEKARGSNMKYDEFQS